MKLEKFIFAAVVSATLFCVTPEGNAAPKGNAVKGCAGLLEGSGSADTVLGLEHYYDPIKLKVSRKGIITGQALKQTWLPGQDEFDFEFEDEDEPAKELVTFSGRITKARQTKTEYAGFATIIKTNCQFSGSFSDGTSVSGKISNTKGFMPEYSGTFKLRAGEATGSGSLSDD